MPFFIITNSHKGLCNLQVKSPIDILQEIQNMRRRDPLDARKKTWETTPTLHQLPIPQTIGKLETI